MSLFRPRFFPAILLTFLTSAPSEAAVEFTVLNGPGAEASIGEAVDILIRVSANGSEPVEGLGASVWGYNTDIVRFIDGEAVPAMLFQSCDPQTGCSGGLVNAKSGSLVETSLPGWGPRVQIFEGSGGPIGTGELDPGLDGVIGGGDAHFRIRFRVIAAELTQLTIGTGYAGDAVLLAGGVTEQTSTSFVTGWVPEPTTTLLLGLGPAGLAATPSSGGRAA